jgi:hypothetical protein
MPNIITGLGQTPIIDTTIPSTVTTTPLQPTNAPPLPQEQKQIKKSQ